MIANLFLTDMHNSLKRLVDVEKKMSSQKLYSKPSDNPSEVARGMKVGSLVSHNEQFVKNLDDAVTWLKSTETALAQATDLLSSLREKAIYAGDGSLSTVDRHAIAEDILAMRDELIQVANSNIQGRYLFSGYETDTKAFVKKDDGSVVYQGDSGRIAFGIEQEIVGTVSLNGRDVFPLSFTKREITSVEVPIDFTWSGSSERLVVKVGDKTGEVLLPKRWADNNEDSVADLTDYDGFLQPGEQLKGYSLDEIAEAINSSESAGRLVYAKVEKDFLAGTQRLVLESLSGEPLRVSSLPWSDNTARGQIMTSEIVGTEPEWSAAQDGTISVVMGDGKHYEIDISAGDTLSDVAKALSDIPGLWVGVRPDGSIAVASDNTEPFSFEASGSAVDLFGVARQSQVVENSKDINRMGLSSFLGLEVNRKSTFFAPGSVIGDTTVNKLDMVLSSGENSVRLVIQDDSDLTLSELADRIKAVAGDWLDVVVQKDSPESNVTDTTSQDSEGASERLVIYTKDGGPLNVYDKEGSWSQTLGLNTARYTSDLSNVEFPTAISAEIPAKIGVEIGSSTYEVKLYRDDVIASDGVHIDPRSFALAVQKQVGSDKLNFDLINSDSGVAFYSATGEPLRIYDLPYADPSLGGITSGLASETGLQTGIIGDWVSAATVTGVESSFVIATEGRELSVRVGPSETLADVAEKLKTLAGSWIDVSLMSDGAGKVRLALSAKDGSPLSIYDVEGTPSRLFKVDTDVRLNAGTWAGNTGVLSISVDGYSDDIDLRGASTLSEIADLVNARFGNGDVEAKVVDNMGTEELVFYSPGGKVLTVTPPAGINVVSGPVSPRRGESTGPYNQGVVKRSAANQREEDIFALLDDLAKAVERGSVDIISDSFLPKLDQAIDDALRARALGGALQRRYEAARSRLETDNIAFTEQYSEIMDVDIAEAAMEFQTSQMVYQATLATIAKVVQPTLVDYLS